MWILAEGAVARLGVRPGRQETGRRAARWDRASLGVSGAAAPRQGLALRRSCCYSAAALSLTACARVPGEALRRVDQGLDLVHQEPGETQDSLGQSYHEHLREMADLWFWKVVGSMGQGCV